MPAGGVTIPSRRAIGRPPGSVIVVVLGRAFAAPEEERVDAPTFDPDVVALLEGVELGQVVSLHPAMTGAVRVSPS